MSRADHHHTVHDAGRGMEADIGGFGVKLLIEVELQIDRPTLAEIRDEAPRLRIQRDQAIADRHIQDAFLDAVGPIAEPAAGQLARRIRGTRAFLLPVEPQQFAGLRIQGHHASPGAGGGVKHSIGDQRRSLQIVFRRRAERSGPEPPGDFQIAEIPGVYLIERGVAGIGQVVRIMEPVRVGGSRGGFRTGRRRPDEARGHCEQRDAQHLPPCEAPHLHSPRSALGTKRWMRCAPPTSAT